MARNNEPVEIPATEKVYVKQQRALDRGEDGDGRNREYEEFREEFRQFRADPKNNPEPEHVEEKLYWVTGKTRGSEIAGVEPEPVKRLARESMLAELERVLIDYDAKAVEDE